ncbi:MAG TPA: HEAT repeat domain-containing protein [Thermoanaerobaculia bacterium]|jgi:hypothetical protein
MRRIGLVFALSLALVSLHAQPHLKNASVTNAAAGGNLGAQVRAASTTWVAYNVPAVNNDATICCMTDSWRVGTCNLEGTSNNFNISDGGKEKDLTLDTQLSVFYRVSGRTIEKVRVFTTNCGIDAHGATITWLDGVDPKQSVSLLASLITDDGETVSRRALDALAMHADPSATDALEAIVRSNAGHKPREHAAFWLGNSRGKRGYEIVKRLANDPNETTSMREKAVFAMTQSEEPQRIDDLISIARHDPESKVRAHALFWLSQAAGKKAGAALRDAVDNDPDTDVKKKAVFGIAQLPDDQSIPLLADLMRTHKNKEVRKQAAFWLGQKNDPRALAAIESVLKN